LKIPVPFFRPLKAEILWENSTAMHEIIKLLTDGFIRHLIQVNRLSISIKREEKENVDWIVRKNGCDIGRRNVGDNSNIKRKKL